MVMSNKPKSTNDRFPSPPTAPADVPDIAMPETVGRQVDDQAFLDRVGFVREPWDTTGATAEELDAMATETDEERTARIVKAGAQGSRDKRGAKMLQEIQEKKVWESDCAAITVPACFIHLPTGALLSDKSFAKKYGAMFSKKDGNAAGAANRSRQMERYDGLTFEPPENFTDAIKDEITEVVVGPRGLTRNRLYNQYRPNPMTPLRDQKPDIFINHLRYLIPDAKSRLMLADWMAHVVQHPGRKTQFAILLIGKEGTGKSWLADLLKAILGEHNVSTPRNKTLVRDFNGWLNKRVLGIVHELKGKIETSENLKDIITQSKVEVNLKGIEAHEIPNYINLFTISNHFDAIPVDDGSRRYLIIECASVPKGALPIPDDKGKPYTRTDAMEKYYAALMESQPPGKPATAETRRVLGWLLDRNLKRVGALNCLSIAPETEAKAKVVEAGRSSLASLMTRAYRAEAAPFSKVFCPVDVVPVLVTEADEKIMPAEQTSQNVARLCRELGCTPILDYAVRVKNGRRHLWALTAQAAAKLRELSPLLLAKLYEDGRAEIDTEAAEKIDAEVAEDFNGG
jgi:hypothetical protein